jgi:hypothetical protein
MQGINMINFVQATKHEVYMYAMLGYLNLYRFEIFQFSTMQ